MCPTAPSQPSYLSFSEVSGGSVNVSWGAPLTPNGQLEGYRVVYQPTAAVQGMPTHASYSITCQHVEEDADISFKLSVWAGVSKVVTVDVRGSWQRWLKARDLIKGVTYTFSVQALTVSYGPAIQANMTAQPVQGTNSWNCVNVCWCPLIRYMFILMAYWWPELNAKLTRKTKSQNVYLSLKVLHKACSQRETQDRQAAGMESGYRLAAISYCRCFSRPLNAQIALEYYVYVLLSDQVRVTGVKPFWKRWVSFIYVKWFNMFASLHLSINQQKTDQRLMWRLGQEINIHQHTALLTDKD